MVNTPSTHHRKHVSKARAYKHAKHVSTQARQAREHVSTPSTRARDLADLVGKENDFPLNHLTFVASFSSRLIFNQELTRSTDNAFTNGFVSKST